MVKPVVVTQSERGLEVHVPEIPGWDGFDKLCRYLEKHYGAEEVESIIGPDAGVTRFALRGIEICVDYEDPYGSTIAGGEAAAETLREVAADLERRLA